MRFTGSTARARRTGILFLFVALVLGVTGAQGVPADAAANQDLVLGYGRDDVRSLDPHFSTTDKRIVQSIFNGLVRFPPGRARRAEIEPDLAVDWSQSEDGLTWTFDLREGVQWHSGYGEFTADDVVFSINRVRDPAVGSPYAEAFAQVQEVTKVDDYTVEIRLSEPDPIFLMRVADTESGFVVSKAAFEELGEDVANTPIGTGPFVFADYVPRERVVLMAHQGYFRGRPIIDTLTYRFVPDQSTANAALLAGELHAISGPNSDSWFRMMSAEDAVVVDLVGPTSVQYLLIDLTREPFTDVRVRQAFAHAIDRNAMARGLVGQVGGPLTTIVTPEYFGYSEEGVPAFSYDPEQARSLLAEAGYPNGFRTEIFMSERSDYLRSAQVVQEYLRAAGVDLRINVVGHSTYHEYTRQGTNTLIIYGPFQRLPDMDVILTQFFHSSALPPGTNLSQYTGSDEEIEEARTTTDQELREQLYARIQSDILSEVAVVPLIYVRNTLARSERLVLGYEIEENLNFHYKITEKTYLAVD
jgi:peptide/nickel transport system substrate-binding protein